jgi:hypothetical protein
MDVTISGDDALLWLNDRLGQLVTVAVRAESGDGWRYLFSARGELHHWREEVGMARLWERPATIERMVGFYMVGATAEIDLTLLGHRSVFVRDLDEPGSFLNVELAEDVWLEIYPPIRS